MGEFQPAGVRPKFMPRLEAAGINLPLEVFLGNVAGGTLRR